MEERRITMSQPEFVNIFVLQVTKRTEKAERIVVSFSNGDCEVWVPISQITAKNPNETYTIPFWIAKKWMKEYPSYGALLSPDSEETRYLNWQAQKIWFGNRRNAA